MTYAASSPSSAASTSALLHLAGKVSKVLFQGESGFAVLGLEVSAGSPTTIRQLQQMGAYKKAPNGDYYPSVTVAGEFASRMAPGMTLDIRGTLEKSKYGPQIKAKVGVQELPQADDLKGIEAFLAHNVKGIGPCKAAAILEKFGGHTLKVIEEAPDALRSVSGITPELADRIKECWNSQVNGRALSMFLGSVGLPQSLGPRLLQFFAGRTDRTGRPLDALVELKRNPWSMSQIPRIGFKTADAIALKMGKDPLSDDRLRAALSHCTKERGLQGHTVTDVAQLTQLAARLLEMKPDAFFAARVQERIEELRKKHFRGLREIDGKVQMSTVTQAESERMIARSLHKLTRDIDAPRPDYKLVSRAEQYMSSGACGFVPDEEQKAAIRSAFIHPVSIITGGPGCGKTTITRAIGEIAKGAGLAVVFSAPTGKAAQRTKQSTGFDSQTLHSRLKIQAGESFQRKEATLEGDLFILDESSMAENGLMAQFLDALQPGQRVVLIGDVDQLPSVGPGSAFADLIHSAKVPVTRLQTIHRQGEDSVISSNAHAIIQGKSEALQLQNARDFRYLEDNQPASIVSNVVQSWQRAVERYGVEEVQVLVPSWKNECGATNISHAIRELDNPAREGQPRLTNGGEQFREGDRLLFTKNTPNKFNNGETGTLLKILEPESADDPLARVRMSLPDASGGVRIVDLHAKDLDNMRLGYAITIHKSQGSEYKAVIVVATEQHMFMLNRNLLYTGITRGKEEVTLLATPRSLRRALSHRADARETGLVHEIENLLGGAAPAAACAPAPKAPPETENKGPARRRRAGSI